jgi:hypothetical protein
VYNTDYRYERKNLACPDWVVDIHVILGSHMVGQRGQVDVRMVQGQGCLGVKG